MKPENNTAIGLHFGRTKVVPKHPMNTTIMTRIRFSTGFALLVTKLVGQAGPLDTWVTLETGATNGLNGIAYGNGQFVVVGEGGDIAISTNGANWVVRQSGTTFVIQFFLPRRETN
jgi:hypothetical protein